MDAGTTAFAVKEAIRASETGSPRLLHALGRIYGLGPNERAALSGSPGDMFPNLLPAVALVALGFFVGVRAQKRWPRKLPSWVTGD